MAPTSHAERAPEEVARALYGHLERREFDELRELLDPDVVWHATGAEGLDGTYRGRDAVIEALRAQRDRDDHENVEIRELEVTSLDDAEVAGFGFGVPGNTQVVKATSAQQCAKEWNVTQSVLVVRGPTVAEVGSIVSPRLGF